MVAICLCGCAVSLRKPVSYIVIRTRAQTSWPVLPLETTPNSMCLAAHFSPQKYFSTVSVDDPQAADMLQRAGLPTPWEIFNECHRRFDE